MGRGPRGLDHAGHGLGHAVNVVAKLRAQAGDVAEKLEGERAVALIVIVSVVVAEDIRGVCRHGFLALVLAELAVHVLVTARCEG